jgi:AraC-like DNA-binding protein
MRKGLVIIMDDGRMLSLSSRNGLCSDTIFSIIKDSENTMWFTSTHGIFSLPFQHVVDAALDSSGTLKCFPFDAQDGIKRSECIGGVQPASMIRKDGSLWFPTVEGIAVSQKGTLTESNPHISIDSVIADGKEMELGDSINSSGTLSLLEIKFTASRFIHPERLKVNHILSSYENEWNLDPYLEKRSVSYQKVGAGNYSFKIETVGEKGTSVTKSIGLFVENDSIFNMIDMKWIFVAILLSSIGAILFINIKRKKKIQKQENINNEASTEITAEISETDEFSSEDAPEENYQELKDDSPKYEKSRLDDSIAESYANELKQLMEAKKPYKDPDLTLPELAKKLNLSTNILSQVINGYCCQNFYNFVNIYRAEEVIGMMKDPLCENRSILDLAYDAGFKSKTTFNTIFKKHTGLTPSEFRKNIFQNKSNKDRKD